MLKRKALGRGAIKEAIDNLPIRICCFNRQGLPILCNRTMDRLAFEMTGHDLQQESELDKAFHALPHGTFTSSDGTVWRCSVNTDCLESDGFTEYIVSDITELSRQNEELQEKNEKLTALAENMRQITKNVVAIAREEEILSMKMGIHGDTGRAVLKLHKYYREDCPAEDRAELRAQLRSMIAKLQGEVGKNDDFDLMQEVFDIAEGIGVKITLDGELPQDYSAKYLLAVTVREALTNTVRHAGGDTLFVRLRYADDKLHAEITDNGTPPKTEITEGGGLSSLRARIEKEGGTLTITSLPRFILGITVSCKGGSAV